MSRAYHTVWYGCGVTKQRWIDEGKQVLAEEGVAGVRIDRIAARVGLSKGSFFHHFANAAAFRSAILEEWRAGAVAQLQDAPSGHDLGDLAGRIDDLLDVRLDGAVRAWASHDPDAAAAVQDVDRVRLQALEQAWHGLVADPRRARTAALLPHLLVIGATVARPTIDDHELRAVFQLLAELIPAAAAMSERHTESEGGR